MLRNAAILVASALLAGCGSGEETPARPQAESQHAPPQRTLKEDCEKGSWTAFGAFWSGADSEEQVGPLSESLAVFARARSAADDEPTGTFDRLPEPPSVPPGGDETAPEHRYPGSTLAEQSRLLLADLGSVSGRLYALPTANGWVCVTFVTRETGGGGGCTPQLDRGIGLYTQGQACGDAPAFVYGLAANNVAGVRLILGSVVRNAVVGENGFFAELSPGEGSLDRLRAILVTRRDGSSERIELPRLPRTG